MRRTQQNSCHAKLAFATHRGSRGFKDKSRCIRPDKKAGGQWQRASAAAPRLPTNPNAKRAAIRPRSGTAESQPPAAAKPRSAKNRAPRLNLPPRTAHSRRHSQPSYGLTGKRQTWLPPTSAPFVLAEAAAFNAAERVGIVDGGTAECRVGRTEVEMIAGLRLCRAR